MTQNGPYAGRQRVYNPLVVDVEEWVEKCEKRLEAVVRGSIQDLVINAQTPVAQGGRMRVDTGFLRASGRASLEGWPSGPNIKPKEAKPNSYTYNGKAVSATLLNMKIGDTFYFGWTANYAEYRELYDGFMEGSMRHWQRYVAFNTDKARQRFK